MDELLIVAVVFLLNWGAHWMPWSVVALADRDGRMKRVAAYVFGTLTIITGFALWTRDWHQVGMLVVVVVSAGAGAVAARVVRAVREYQALKGDVADMGQVLAGGQREQWQRQVGTRGAPATGEGPWGSTPPWSTF